MLNPLLQANLNLESQVKLRVNYVQRVYGALVYEKYHDRTFNTGTYRVNGGGCALCLIILLIF